MKRIVLWASTAAATLAPVVCVGSAGTATELDQKSAAELDRRRLVGQANYENDKFAEAANEFRRCIELVPDSAIDHFNLGLVLMRAQEYEES
ncbi:MAG: hypothetical protein ACYSUI_12260, partial [Planctomycetota bacterium]